MAASSCKRAVLRSSSGFTLLEVLIAIAIMVVAYAAILMVQSSSINTSLKAKQLNIVSMLAKKVMVETEYLIENKAFSEVKEEEKGEFTDPYQDYRWVRTVKELKFPSLNVGAGGGNTAEGGGGASSEGQTDYAEMLTKLMTNHLSKSIREVTVTVFWRKGTGEQEFALSTYWVDLNHEFALQE